MFTASHPTLLLDYFRVPVDPTGATEEPDLVAVHPTGEERQAMYWIRRTGGAPAFHSLGTTSIFARVASDESTAAIRARLGGTWMASETVTNAEGAVAGSVWTDSDGRVLLPFDPDEAVVNLWSEAYGTAGSRSLAMETYYRVRRLLPRQAQLALRRAYSRRQARRTFPRWPVEPALHDLYDLVLGLLARATQRPVPYIDAWPDDHRWAIVLTHDVETEVGYRNINLLRGEEERAGFRSSWNLVPMRYEIGSDVVDDLTAGGFEVGVHGLYHDGRDLASEAMLDERLPQMHDAATRWGAVGFRSPATHRTWALMPRLGFDYDSSYPDSDPFEPQSGGCCSWLPYFNQDLVELPITLPQDHTLFVILREPDERVWIDKAAAIRDRGGMALLITHPDYMLEPRWVQTYARFLAAMAGDDQVWRALPREVSTWWRERAASTITGADGEWRVDGPAAGRARVSVVSSK